MKKATLIYLPLGAGFVLLLEIGLGVKQLIWSVGFFVFCMLIWLSHELYKKLSNRKCPMCEGTGRVCAHGKESECYLCHGTGKF